MDEHTFLLALFAGNDSGSLYYHWQILATVAYKFSFYFSYPLAFHGICIICLTEQALDWAQRVNI